MLWLETAAFMKGFLHSLSVKVYKLRCRTVGHLADVGCLGAPKLSEIFQVMFSAGLLRKHVTTQHT